ncbi:hypothetical protein [Actinacidiphila bryophytorum]|uniref:hypothetical protein n=1 Tax=Actinacidiphila bryophytorum TaxID=1436133 RepID=UPI001961BFE7|nr:hypothetical protein [Actinacidiphila bryophytorum]MBM9438334.1 hypothetical protein [Actinacidiphila bryophytorum]MBN6542640.1 hypothetical protein [Actinacidiphila bryophytorum]
MRRKVGQGIVLRPRPRERHVRDLHDPVSSASAGRLYATSRPSTLAFDPAGTTSGPGAVDPLTT